MKGAKMQSIRYEGTIPATLRMYCDRHRHQVVTVAARNGYCTDSGFVYDVTLRGGWCDGPACHSIIGSTVKDTLSALKEIRTCDCADCLKPNH